MDEQIILDVRGLGVEFYTDQGVVRAVDNLNFQLKKGRILGLAGESGCGKSVTALSIMRLLPKPVSRMVQGQVIFNHRDLSRISKQEMCGIRGKKMAMIFQEPMTALNPVQGIGKQMMEVYKLHYPKMSVREMERAAITMLEKTGVSDPEKMVKAYPHELSGGMRQRVMISMSLACEPDLLIADEPTTALDVTVQAQILALIKTLQAKSDLSVILITHDLGVIAENCDDVVIMYAGRIAEKARVVELFKHPCHPYTKGLLTSIPSLAKKSKTILPTIKGNVPSLMNLPEACRFADRCAWVQDICREKIPGERIMGQNHTAACHLAGINKT